MIAPPAAASDVTASAVVRTHAPDDTRIKIVSYARAVKAARKALVVDERIQRLPRCPGVQLAIIQRHTHLQSSVGSMRHIALHLNAVWQWRNARRSTDIVRLARDRRTCAWAGTRQLLPGGQPNPALIACSSCSSGRRCERASSSGRRGRRALDEARYTPRGRKGLMPRPFTH
jgi:hypothetical protein